MNRGQKLPLADAVGAGAVIIEVVASAPGTDVDVTAFGLDASGKLVSDDYIIFYNQMASPNGSISKVAGPGQKFRVDIASVPASVHKISVCLTLDGPATMSQVPPVNLTLTASKTLSFALPTNEFGSEKAVMLIDIYRHATEGWRLGCVGQGFAGGLSALLAHYGGTEATPAAPAAAAPAPAPVVSRAVSLEKKVEAANPRLVSLVKTAAVSLAKAKVEETVRARVTLVLDVSGSMYDSYGDGDVQKILDRMLPLALHLDDDGTLDTWAYSDRCRRLPGTTLANVNGYIDSAEGGWRRWNIGGGNYEPAVMTEIIKGVKAEVASGKPVLPLYVIFVTDGGITQEAKISELVRESSSLPIFWQFVGYAGSSYGVLHRLDKLSGRKVDNAGFFTVDGLNRITDADLYDRILSEFPTWLKAAKTAGIVR